MRKILHIIIALMLCHLILHCQPSLQWSQHISSSSFDGGFSNAVDKKGNIYTIGMFQNTADFDPGPGVFNLSSNGAWDTYVTKSDPSGNLLWAKSIGSWAADIPITIFTNNEGESFISGYFLGTVDFDPNVGVYNLTAKGYGVFLMKLNSLGNLLWAKTINCKGYWPYGNGIAVNQTGEIFLTGTVKDSVDFDPGAGTHFLYSPTNTIFLLKLDATGGFDWVFSPGAGQGQSVQLDNNGNVYVTGSFKGIADFDPSAGSYNLNAPNENAFVWKLKNDMSLAWVKQFNGNNLSRGNDIALDDQNNVYTTGVFIGTTDFDPDSTSNSSITSNGQEDVFISKIDEKGKFSWVKTIGGIKTDNSTSIDIDDFNNLYVVGFYCDTVDFDPNSGNYNFISEGGSMDAFLLSLDQSGNLNCVTSFGGPGSCGDLIRGVSIDHQNNVILTGQFGSIMDVDPGPGTYTISAIGSGADIFNLKLSNCDYVTSNADDEKIIISEILIYPNPSTGKILLSLSNKSNEKTMCIYDVNGKCISKELFMDQNKVIDLSHEAKGIYFLEVITDEKRMGQNVVIE